MLELIEEAKKFILQKERCMLQMYGGKKNLGLSERGAIVCKDIEVVIDSSDEMPKVSSQSVEISPEKNKEENKDVPAIVVKDRCADIGEVDFWAVKSFFEKCFPKFPILDPPDDSIARQLRDSWKKDFVSCRCLFVVDHEDDKSVSFASQVTNAISRNAVKSDVIFAERFFEEYFVPKNGVKLFITFDSVVARCDSIKSKIINEGGSYKLYGARLLVIERKVIDDADLQKSLWAEVLKTCKK